MIVHDQLRFGVVIHRIDREIAARSILLLRSPDVIAQHATAGIHRMLNACQSGLGRFLIATDLARIGAVQKCAEGRNLDHFMLAPPSIHNVDDSKATPDDEGTLEQAFDIIRGGVGGDIKVFRTQAQKQIAHRATHDISGITGVFERCDHFPCLGIDQLSVDPMLGLGHLNTLAKLGCAALDNPWRHQFFNQFFNHSNKSSMRQPRSFASARKRGSGLVATGS